ncbi:Protein FAR1-RELATED SEQUENCE like [Melia azedarach]|uniref:Protein FAR1-RELATED SEQUENCE like n=1 Tax=Melia azedarach TaxID=155640 RepID=A0ACC1YJ43_MELAZ|nr:Protein FAR1-RELATED SEQUENCE like [Melia azedarach]
MYKHAYINMCVIYINADMEIIVEDKTVITESPTGGESGVCEVDASHEPYEGMLFESEEAAKAFYDEYARRVGFSTRIVSSRKSERDGSIISRRLACNKEGFNVNRQKSGRVQIRKRESIREGCKAMILVKREKPGRWVVTKFVREHNHPLVISSEKVRPAPDEKDRRIRELSSELHRANQQLAACREQLRMVMMYIEEHTNCLSKTVEEAVHGIKEVESEKQCHHR